MASSSTTRTFTTAPPREVEHHHQPTTGGVLDHQAAALRLGEAAGHRETESDTVARRGVTQPLERLEHPGAVGVGDTRALVGDPELHRGARCSDPDTSTTSLWRNALEKQVGQHPLQQPGVDECRREGTDLHALGPVEVLEGAVDHLVERHLVQRRPDRPGLQAAHVEQVADHRREPRRRLHDRVEQGRAVLGGEQVVVRAQGLGCRADAGQRRAQVVGDRGQERRTRAVAGLELARGLGLPGQLLAFAEHTEVGGEPTEHPTLAGVEASSAKHQSSSVADRHGRVLVADLGLVVDELRRVPPKVSRTSSSSPGTSYSPPRTVRLSIARVLASFSASTARCRRRAAESTTAATASEVTTKTTSVTMSRALEMSKVCRGSVNQKFSAKVPSTDAATAGQRPPTRAQAMARTR